MIPIQPDQCGSIRLFLGQSIQHIISEVEVFRIMEFDIFQIAVFIQRFIGKTAVDQIFFCGNRCIRSSRSSRRSRSGFFGIALHHKSQKFAGLIAISRHAVGLPGIINNAVPGIHDFHLIPQLDFQAAGKNVIKFLPGMAGKMQFRIAILSRSSHQKGLRLTILEIGSQMLIFKIMPPLERHPAILAGQRIKTQFGRFPQNQCADIYAETLCTMVNKGKRVIHIPPFVCQIFFRRHAGDLCHFFHRDLQNFPGLFDPPANQFQLIFHDFYTPVFFQGKKKTPSRRLPQGG